MIQIRKSRDRGHFNHGWLDTYHSFSFGDYYDPENMGFKHLRVLNEDWIHEDKGFGTHSHKNMEIVSYVVQGTLSHKDSMGTGSDIKAGEVQYMSAGSGVTHSEFNHSKKEKVHLLQIWILPRESGGEPKYQQLPANKFDKRNWSLAVSPDGKDGSIKIKQDAWFYLKSFNENETSNFSLPETHSAWVQIVKGELDLNGKKLEAGDGAAIQNEKDLRFLSSKSGSEVLLIQMQN